MGPGASVSYVKSRPALRCSMVGGGRGRNAEGVVRTMVRTFLYKKNERNKFSTAIQNANFGSGLRSAVTSKLQR